MTLARHTDGSFDDELATLRNVLREMGGVAHAMVGDAATLLTSYDADLAERVIATDRRLDALRDAVDERAVLTIARRQPVAVDLRTIVAAMRVSGALERVGDLAKNVAKRAAVIEGGGAPREAAQAVRRLGQQAASAIDAALNAYDSGDIVAAEKVWRGDADLDGMLASLFRELLTYMAESPRAISPCTHLMFSAKNMERIGDHATAIAEAVRYVVTGSAFEGERPKVDAIGAGEGRILAD
jgi:phosphate transport system protein